MSRASSLHHQLQERPTEINRLLQHQIGAIRAVELDLLLDDGSRRRRRGWTPISHSPIALQLFSL
jgi:hypothetical protein